MGRQMIVSELELAHWDKTDYDSRSFSRRAESRITIRTTAVSQFRRNFSVPASKYGIDEYSA